MLSFRKVLIIGPGLIGASIGMNLCRRKMAEEVWGVSSHAKNLDFAKQRGALTHVKRVSASGGIRGESLKEADLVILATPVSEFRSYLQVIAQEGVQTQGERRSFIVMDVGSTKEEVVHEAEKILPHWVSFVGAHPIAGSEKSGAEAAVANLFQKRVCVLTPTSKTRQEALKKIEQLWQALGSTVVSLSPHEHDRILASVSHLPQLLAFTLMLTVGEGRGLSEAKKIQTNSLRDMTRLAASSPEMWTAICQDNRQAILHAIKAFEKNLGSMREAIEQKDTEALHRLFKKAGHFKQQL